jgi:hypothetical protein
MIGPSKGDGDDGSHTPTAQQSEAAREPPVSTLESRKRRAPSAGDNDRYVNIYDLESKGTSPQFLIIYCINFSPPWEKRTHSSAATGVISPAVSTQSRPECGALTDSGRTTKEQGSSGPILVPKLLRSKKLSIKRSSQ